ncbi:formin-like protein 5 [Macadamia integrifolia]|uniref:formin-like protein 5 n=1 Tax=Macadamia integrifolia TaxID=60698 RepID=UPI001C4F65AF|nr:formin-like protein 5 [Macadamia integrifolia]
MRLRRIGCLMIHVVLLFTLATGSSKGGKRIERFLVGDKVGPSSPEIDEEVAQQLWIKCRSDLMHLKEANENFDLFRLKERARGSSEVKSEAWSPGKGRLQKAINVLPPQTKQTLLGCLRTKNHLSHISGDAKGSRNGYKKHLGSLSGWPHSSRQHRGSGESSRLHKGNEVLQNIRVTPAFAPPVDPPAYSPAPTSDPSPASPRAPDPEHPVEPPTKPFFPPSSGVSSPSPSTIDHSSAIPDLVPQLPSQKHNSSQKTVVVAVVATAVGTFAFAAMVFSCYRKCHRNNGVSKDGQKDDRPLLTLNLSDLSGGSSHKSFSLGNSMQKEKIGSQSFGTNSHYGWGSSLDSNLPIDASITEAPLSGTVASSPNSLKPPPGRATPPPPAPPPMPPAMNPRLPPPAPPKGVFPPPRGHPQAPMGSKLARPSSHKSNHPEDTASDGEAQKTKLKPFFWDKVLANPDHSMVWHQIKAGSFQVNEETIETLFGYNAASEKNKNELKKGASSSDHPQYIQIIDSKKAQNLAILLRALNVTTEEVRDALQEGTELDPIALVRQLSLINISVQHVQARILEKLLILLKS